MNIRQSIWTCAAVVVLSATAFGADTLYVQVAETRLRASAGFLSPSVGVLAYGEAVSKLGQAEGGGPWVKVKNTRIGEGWLHNSALSQTALVLKAGDKSASIKAERAEATLGGKGFSQETEADYKKKNPTPTFAEIDKVDALRPSDEDLLAFARQGGLLK